MTRSLASARTAAKSTADQLFGKGLAYFNQDADLPALQRFEQALTLYRQVEEKEGQAHCLFFIGTILFTRGQPEQAFDAHQDALKLYKEIGDNSKMAVQMTCMGNILSEVGRTKDALAIQREALKISSTLPDSTYSAHVLGDIGLTLLKLGQLKESSRCYKQALQIHDSIGDEMSKAGDLGGIGLVLAERGKFEEALEYFQRSLKICERFQFKLGAAKRYSDIGVCLHKLGQFDEALKQSSKALNMHTEQGYKGGVASVCNQIGAILMDAARYREAQEYFQKALELFKEVGDKSGEAASWTSTGALLVRVGQPENALEQFQKALGLHRENSNKVGIALNLSNIGVILMQIGQLDIALSAFQDSLKLSEELENKSGIASSMLNIGGALYRLAQLDGALEQLKRAWKLYDELALKRESAETLMWIGRIYLELGKEKEAWKHEERAHKLAQKLNAPELASAIWEVKGDISCKVNDYDHTYKYYLRSVQLIESMRGGLILEEQKISFLRARGRENVYDKIISALHTELKRDKEALEFVERAKSRAFLDLLRYVDLPAPQNVPSNLLLEERKAATTLQNLNQRIRNVPQTKVPTLSKKIASIQDEIEQVLDKMEKYAPHYVTLRRGNPLAFDKIQQLLEKQGREIVLLEYYATEKRLFIFVLRSGDRKPYVAGVPLASERLEDYIERYDKEVVNHLYYPDLLETWQGLADYVIVPIMPFLDGCELLIVIPHGLLHYVPFHALQVNGRYLIERFPIVYAPSTTVLGYCRAKKSKRQLQTCLSLGYTPKPKEKAILEGEANQVAAILQSKPYVGSKAKKSLLQQIDTEYDVIHLSCHAYFDSVQPLRSRLLLANEELLTAEEIFGLSLNANLVSLSACETALSEVRSGDELIGLTRAFIYAGAASVLVSLWRVHATSTLEMMRSFYRKLRNGELSKVEALREAQLDIMGRPDSQFAHPYFWAPFMLVGDWE